MTGLYAGTKDKSLGVPPYLSAEQAEESPQRHSRILVVEDDYLVGLELEYRLQEAGFNILGIVATAEEAVRLASSERPDLVVMDVRLAGSRDGIDAAKELYAKHGIRSIFATAHADALAKKRGRDANPLGWLQKPYKMEALIALIRTAKHT